MEMVAKTGGSSRHLVGEGAEGVNLEGGHGATHARLFI